MHRRSVAARVKRRSGPLLRRRGPRIRLILMAGLRGPSVSNRYMAFRHTGVGQQLASEARAAKMDTLGQGNFVTLRIPALARAGYA